MAKKLMTNLPHNKIDRTPATKADVEELSRMTAKSFASVATKDDLARLETDFAELKNGQSRLEKDFGHRKRSQESIIEVVKPSTGRSTGTAPTPIASPARKNKRVLIKLKSF